MTFNNLSLDPRILRTLTESGYLELTKIQAQAIPRVLDGVDIRASAPTGTGKTAAFLLPALHHIVANPQNPGRGPRVLIVAPTRELAQQISQQADKYSKYLNRIKTVCISGGVSYQIQNRQLSKPHDLLIATPGRLIDLMNQGKIDFSRVELLVLDEADRMLDMGFLEPMKEITAALPKERQTLLFSATLKGAIFKISEMFLKNPEDITIQVANERHENIDQKLFYADNVGHKNRMLDYILAKEEVKYTIIFTATKRHADQLVSELREKGQRVAALHGDMSQHQRTRTTTRFREGRIEILVATDVAARGLDVNLITHVVNFDLPRNPEDYVHRIGRTGRAGAKGTALSFAAERDLSVLQKIEHYTKQAIEVVEIEGLEPRRQRNSKPNRPGGRSRRHSPRNPNEKRGFKVRGKAPRRGARAPFKAKVST
ncbi:MAG: ATP-dependent RNA helicase RhlE [Chlamydiae bacterium]|nr:ATP-dependent RNA helicase RhlE [Chlamydiota bacterium]